MYKPTVLVKLNTILPGDKELISNILKIADIQEYELVNLLYYKCPNYLDGHLYIAFGIQATSAAFLTSNNVIELPEFSKLTNKIENKVYREMAFKTLSNLNAYIKTSGFNDINQVELTEKFLINIEKYLKDNKIEKITGLDKNGKTVCIRLNEEDKSDAEYSINLYELLAVKFVKEVLGLSNINIIRRDTNE